jgi:drug/metabolite transporter (DMT)-like permease
MQFSGVMPSLAVLGACLSWGIDNNLTRKVALTDASFIAMTKGLIAGFTNLTIAFLAGVSWPSILQAASAGILGFFCYGISLVMFVRALRDLGAARTGAYFSIAPFFGAALSVVLLNEPVSTRLIAAGLLMAFGLWLHLSEVHNHEHHHPFVEHSHNHVHDDHHNHVHDSESLPLGPHTHEHRHEPLSHSHPHFPDLHHDHSHLG